MGNCINKFHTTSSLTSLNNNSDSSSKSPSMISVQSAQDNQDSLSFELQHIDSFLDTETESKIYTLKAEPVCQAVQSNIKSTQINEKPINKKSLNFDIYKPSRIKQFFKQDVEKIRQSKVRFVDKTFPPSIHIITKSVQSEFAQQLFNNYQVQNRYTLTELGQKIRWQPTKVISYKLKTNKPLTNEFVLDKHGKSPNTDLNKYLTAFSIEDVFQGCLGDCFLLAAILGITYHKELLGFLIPNDNSLKENQKFGVYHFRLWSLGEWYDVVIDDYLPVDHTFNPCFTRNITYMNEFWVCLFEKAIAKFVGKFDNLNGGYMENAAMLMSGGIHDTYFCEIVQHVSTGKNIRQTSTFAIQAANSMLREQKNLRDFIPNSNELFLILQTALSRKCLIGAHSYDTNTSKYYGIFEKHQYAVTDAFLVGKNCRVLKVQNPHNIPDQIKKTQKYAVFEKYLIQNGQKATFKGEFYMKYEDFLNCFENLSVCNLLPEKEYPLPKKSSPLRKKSTLFTRWKIHSCRGILMTKKQLGVELSIQKSSLIILALVQRYALATQTTLIKLNVFKKQNQQCYPMATHSSTFFFLQQCFQLSLSQGDYVCLFEPYTPMNEKKEACVRVFLDHKTTNSVNTNFSYLTQISAVNINILTFHLDLMSELTSGPLTSSTTTLCDSNMTRPSPSSLRKNQQNLLTSSSSNISQSSSDSFDDIVKRILNNLESNESQIQHRLKAFEELIEISELFDLKEKTVHILLKSIRDLLNPDLTTLEHRHHAFELLIQFVKKKSEKFENFWEKLHLLTLVLPRSTSNQSYFIKSLFAHDSAAHSTNKQGTLAKKNSHCDDLNYRLDLFNLITKSGNDFKFLDPELTNECLVFILDNSLQLTDRHRQILLLFKNLLENQNNFGVLNENLIHSLSIFLLNFSFFLTNTLNSLNAIDQQPQSSTVKHLNKVQQEDLSLCVDLLHILTNHLTQIDCINHVVLCLCELLDLVWQNKIYLQKSDYQLSRLDSQMFEHNEQITQKIFQCMNNLLCSHIMNCALFSFFNEIFSLNKRYNLHHLNQINGALMHIKKLFDDFKQSQKHKTSDLVKQLHLNCFIYLPDALRSCTRDVQQLEHVEQFKRFIIYENILNLSIDLIHLATHRDFFMCMFTFNSRKFFIEIITHFAEHTNELNENLLRKYADLLNLLDKKDVFASKTSVMKSELNSSSMSSLSASNNVMSQSMTKSFTQSQRGESTSSEESNILKFHKFQEVFYELVYKFPHANLLKDNCLNNCIEYYLQRKYLPYYGDDAINGINVLVEKYFSIHKQPSPTVRKFLTDSLHKRLKEFYDMDHIMFIQKVISEALLPMYERAIQEDNAHYLNGLKSSNSTSSLNNANQQAYQDLIEMKCFISNKLIELTQWHCSNEANMFKLISLFELVISLESKSSIDLLVNMHQQQQQQQQQQPPPSVVQVVHIHQNNNLNYLYKIINHGLIDVFEKHFASTSNDCFTLSCVKILKILSKYLNDHYDNQRKSSSQSNVMLFNYYALIRKDIFEFLLRIRSVNSTNRLGLMNRSNRFKVQESKYLMLTLSSNGSISPTSAQSQQQQQQHIQEKAKYLCKQCEVDLSAIMDLIEKCLDQEIDWNVLMRVLTDLPYFLQYELGIVKHSDFVHRLFRHIYKQEISIFRNRPDNVQRSDYMEKFYPLLASLTLYYPILELSSQEAILHMFAHGINSIRNRFCLEILTIAITEMHESNSIQCGDILLKLSQFSPSQNMAQPILELLSTVSDFKRLDFIFGRKELYISILATAIKYTNPVKFNSFIVQFAHYVICVWFMKCHKEIRKNYATFTCKGLYKEVIVELELLKDNKSPNKSSSTNELLSTELNSNSQMSSSTSSLINKDNESSKFKATNLTENMKQFYKELVDITIDFMSNNMNFDEATYPQIGSTQNQHGFFIDTYPMQNKFVSNVSSSLVSGGVNESKTAKVQKRLWLVGDKIVEIRTGLYSNICQEKLPTLVRNKQRQAHTSNTNASSNQTSSTTVTIAMPIGNHQPTIKSKFIDIPSNKQLNTIESCVSSESSISNSFSSMSLSSNCHTPGNIFDSNGADKLANNNSKAKTLSEIVSESNDTKKFEAVLFDDTSIDTSLNNKSLTQEDNIKHNETNSSQIEANTLNASVQTATIQCVDEKQSYKKKTKSFKRRYKSGLPLTTESIDNELKDDAYLLPFNDAGLSKVSKDDSVLERTNSHDFIRCHHHHHHHHHHHRHRHQKHSQQRDLDDHSLESFRQKDNSNSSSDELNKEICNANCWCNNLVEIKCRYSTKEYSYVTLIENTNSAFHLINMSLFENIVEKAKSSMIDDSTSNSNARNNITLARLAQTACESRRNLQLSRISESSTTTNQDTVGSANFQGDSSSILNNDIEKKPQTPHGSHTDEFLLDAGQSRLRNRKLNLTRMSSLESTHHHQTNSNKQQQEFTSNSSLMNSASSILSNKISMTSFSKYNSRYTTPNSIDPSQVFLQLFQSKHIYNEEKEQPLLLPDIDSIERSIGILDFIPCFTLHKIGVIYIGPNQAVEEKNILTNSYGSLRYKNFINGLGNLIYLKGLETNRFYAGGLETDGSIGDFSLLWYDGVVQVSFHVATMMLTKETINSKKRHIGNDATIIVYNESGEEYQFGTIKGEVNCICIEIVPLKSNTNIVKVKTTPEITQSSWFYHTDPKFVTDQNLSLVVRKMALHADMAAKIYRSQKDSNLYGGKWYERLKLINRIRKIAKEHNAKQLQQQAKATSGPSDVLSSLNSNGSNSKINVSSLNNTDFTNYI